MDEHVRTFLTPADVTAIVTEMKAQGLVHACRYDIEPEDMAVLMEFVRSIRTNYLETKKVISRTVIRILVWGAFAALMLWLGERFSIFKELAKGFMGRGP